MNEHRATVKAQVIAILEDVLADWRQRNEETGALDSDMKRFGGEQTLIEALKRIREELSVEGDA